MTSYVEVETKVRNVKEGDDFTYIAEGVVGTVLRVHDAPELPYIRQDIATGRIKLPSTSILFRDNIRGEKHITTLPSDYAIIVKRLA